MSFLIQDNDGYLFTVKNEDNEKERKLKPLELKLNEIDISKVDIFKDNGFYYIKSLLEVKNKLDIKNIRILSNEPLYNLNITTIPYSQLVLANDDINIKHIKKIHEVELVSTQNVRMIVSTNNGKTWKTYNSGWEEINIENKEKVKKNGITKNNIKDISSFIWDELIKDNNFLRFGYLLFSDNGDKSEISKLIFKCDLKGKWEKAEHVEEYDYYYQYNDILNVVFMADGSYKINYHE